MQRLDASAVATHLKREALIDALDAAFRAAVQVPERQHYAIDPGNEHAMGGTLLIMPAWKPGGSLGVKVVTVFPGNAAQHRPAVGATYLLMNAATGEPQALLDGSELTLRRTGAASALAARYLSAPDASRLTMIGTGQLAPHLIESHATVRNIREVRIWGRRIERAREIAEQLADRSFRIEAVDDLEAAVHWADTVSCATLSQQPLVRGAWLRAGQHVDLVGAFNPEMCEADDEAVARVDLYVDTRLGALAESGELVGACKRGVIRPDAIRAELSEISSGTFKRRHPAAITLFKSVGTALEDLAAAELAVSCAAAT